MIRNLKCFKFRFLRRPLLVFEFGLGLWGAGRTGRVGLGGRESGQVK